MWDPREPRFVLEASALIGRDVPPLAARLVSALAGAATLGATCALGVRLLGVRGGLRACLALLGMTAFCERSAGATGEQVALALETWGALALASAFLSGKSSGRGKRVALLATGSALVAAACLAGRADDEALSPRLFGEAAGALPAGLLALPASLEALRVERNARAFGSPLEERLPHLVGLVWLAASILLFFLRGPRGGTEPALALLVAWFFSRPSESLARIHRMLLDGIAWSFGFVAVLAVPVVKLASDFFPWEGWELEPLLPLPEVLFLALALVLASLLLIRRSRAALRFLGLATLLAFTLLHVRVVPTLDPALSSERLAARLLARTEKESEWASIADPLPGLRYYARKEIAHFPLAPSGIEGLRAWLEKRRGKPRYVVFPARNEAKVLEFFTGQVLDGKPYADLGRESGDGHEVARCRTGSGEVVMRR